MPLSKDRPHTTIKCKVCGKSMSIRDDYLPKHSRLCMSCCKKNNKQAVKHGDYKTRLYRIWLGLKHRRYKTYTPQVCKEWDDFLVFKEWALSHGYKDNLTIDRIDNHGDYEPNNCQWISLAENAGKDKKIFTDAECAEVLRKRQVMGKSQSEMARYMGVSRQTIQRAERRANGWQK